MHSAQLLRALAVALTAFTTAHASLSDVNVQGALGHQLAKRQSSGTGSSAAPPATQSTTSPKTTATPPPNSPSSTSPRTTATPPPPPPPPPSQSTSSNDNNNNSNDNNNTPPPSSTSPQQTTPPQTTPPATDKSPESTESSRTPVTSTSFTTAISTNPTNGQVSTIVSSFVTTHTPGLAGDGTTDNQGQSGMSEDQKKTIIGVVCGIGGAIVLAVVGIVAWRVWGRKRSQEEAEGAFGPSYSPVEKPDQQQPSSQSSRTPFQSTLESYHAPTQVNTASNF